MSGGATEADVDIFGKALKLSGTERGLLGDDDGTICLRKQLFVDGKKEQEPRVLVITNTTCYVVMTVKGGMKLEASFHFLKIQRIESHDQKAATFHITGEARPREFKSKNDEDLLDVVITIVGQLKNTLPLIPYQELMRVELKPEARQKQMELESSRLMENLTSPEVHSVHGFVTVYAFLCRYYGIPFREDVAWNISEIYLSHGFRVLKLNDFEQHNQRLLLPLVSALGHNVYFEGVQHKDNELSPEVATALINVLQNPHRHGFKTLVLSNAGLKRDVASRLLGAVKANPKSSLTHLDLSYNRLDDQCMESLCQALSHLPHGLTTLELTDCGITLKGATMLANSLKENKTMATSLSTLDLSGNMLGPDGQAALSFLAEPNGVATLKLARCSIMFDLLFPALFRGCCQCLQTLDVSENNKVAKKGKGSGKVQKIKQFFGSAISIQSVHMSHTGTTPDIFRDVLEGLKENPNLSGVSLDVSYNELGQGSLKEVAALLPDVPCLCDLNIAHNGLDGGTPLLVGAIGSSSVRKLHLGGNFGKSKNPQEELGALCTMLGSKSCPLQNLSLADSRLKDHMIPLLEAFLTNRTVVELDVSGNDMSDRGARALARTLMYNTKLRTVVWDDNGTTLEGLKSVTAAVKYNHTMRSMPAPMKDALKISKDKKTEKSLEEVLQELQGYLYRNHSPERLLVESAARRQKLILLLTAQQTELDRSIVDLDDILSVIPENEETTPLTEQAVRLRDEAHKVVQLASQLYSQDAEAQQTEAVINQLRQVVATLQTELFKEHVQESSEHMVLETSKTFPALLGDPEAQRQLEGFVVAGMPAGFLEAEIVNRAGPEVANKISQYNLTVSTKVSKHLVETMLKALAEITKKLQVHQPAPREAAAPVEGSGSATLKKRHFSFTAQVKPSKYTEKFKGSEAEEVDFGVVDKLELGPKLEHVTKSRPKPVGRRRPSRKPVMTDDVDGRASHPLLSSLATVSNGETAKAVAESSHISSAKKEETDGRSSPKGSKSPKKQAQSLYVPSKHQTEEEESGRSTPEGKRKSALITMFSKKKDPQTPKKGSGKEKGEQTQSPSSPPVPPVKEKMEVAPKPELKSPPPEEQNAEKASPPVPPSTEKKPLVPPGGIGLGSNVIAQMKRRHTHGKELESDKERKEQMKANSGSEHVEAASPPKGDIPQPAKEEVKAVEQKLDKDGGAKETAADTPKEPADAQKKPVSQEQVKEDTLKKAEPSEPPKSEETTEKKEEDVAAKVEPTKEDPPKKEPRKEEPPKEEPPKEEPPKEEPVKKEAPKEEPLKVEPTKEEPPKEDLPKEEKPKEEPPKELPKEELPKVEESVKKEESLEKKESVAVDRPVKEKEMMEQEEMQQKEETTKETEQEGALQKEETAPQKVKEEEAPQTDKTPQDELQEEPSEKAEVRNPPKAAGVPNEELSKPLEKMEAHNEEPEKPLKEEEPKEPTKEPKKPASKYVLKKHQEGPPKVLDSKEPPKKIEPKETPKKEEPKEPPKKDEPKVAPKKEEPKEPPKKDEPKVAPKKEVPKEPPKKDEPKEAPKKEEPKEPPKKDEPKVAPKKEVPKEPPKKDEPKMAAKKVEPKEPPKKDEPKEAPKKEEPKEPPKKDEPKVAPKKEEPKEPPKKDEPKVAPKKEEPKEPPKSPESKEPAKKFEPKESVKKAEPKETPKKEEVKEPPPKQWERGQRLSVGKADDSELMRILKRRQEWEGEDGAKESEKASPTAVPPPQPDKKEPPPSIKPKPKAPGSETLPPTKPSPPIAQKPSFDRRAQSLSGPKEGAKGSTSPPTPAKKPPPPALPKPAVKPGSQK